MHNINVDDLKCLLSSRYYVQEEECPYDDIVMNKFDRDNTYLNKFEVDGCTIINKIVKYKDIHIILFHLFLS